VACVAGASGAGAGAGAGFLGVLGSEGTVACSGVLGCASTCDSLSSGIFSSPLSVVTSIVVLVFVVVVLEIEVVALLTGANGK
jgi:hypothetical protein